MRAQELHFFLPVAAVCVRACAFVFVYTLDLLTGKITHTHTHTHTHKHTHTHTHGVIVLLKDV